MRQGVVYKYRYDPNMLKVLLNACHRTFAVTSRDLLDKGKWGSLPAIRGLCCAYLRSKGLTYDNIGVAMKMTRHNAMYHCKQHDGRIGTDPDYSVSWDALLDDLGELT